MRPSQLPAFDSADYVSPIALTELLEAGAIVLRHIQPAFDCLTGNRLSALDSICRARVAFNGAC